MRQFYTRNILKPMFPFFFFLPGTSAEERDSRLGREGVRQMRKGGVHQHPAVPEHQGPQGLCLRGV